MSVKIRCMLSVAACLLVSVSVRILMFSPRAKDVSADAQEWNAVRVLTLTTRQYHWMHDSRHLEFFHSDLTRSGDYLAELDCSHGTQRPTWRPNFRLFRNLAWRSGVISPNGHWLLQDEGYPFGLQVTALNGQETISRREYGSSVARVSNPLWYPDNQHWVYLELNRNLWGKFRLVENSFHASKRSYGAYFPFPRKSGKWDCIGGRLLGFIAANRVLVLPGGGLVQAETEGVSLYECSIGCSPRVKEYSIALPAGCHVINVALSPDGKQLAFIMRRHRQSPDDDGTVRHSGELASPAPDDEFVFYTVQRDGTGWHLMGHMRADKSDPDQLQWLPDGKRVSFAYRNNLYVTKITQKALARTAVPPQVAYQSK